MLPIKFFARLSAFITEDCFQIGFLGRWNAKETIDFFQDILCEIPALM